jgi:hypothetical protein
MYPTAYYICQLITIKRSKMAKTNFHVIQCTSCHDLIEVLPPSEKYEIILNEPCPMCDGLAQSLDCSHCLQKITIYWDEEHFVSR